MARLWVENVIRDTAKTGNEYLKVQCVTEDFNSHLFYLWDRVDEFYQLYETGTLCFDCMYGGDANFPKIVSFEPAQGYANEFYHFIYPSDDHARQMVESLITSVADEFYCTLIVKVLSLPGPTGFDTVYDAFCVIPAAKAYHHDYRYGLVRHTHEVMSFVKRVCSSDLYSGTVDEAIALCGAFLHDVGKCFEYAFDGVNTATYGTDVLTNQIYLASHLYKGAELIEVAYQKMCDQDSSYRDQLYRIRVEHLKHIVLAHHLQRDWAAVAQAPQTLEAYLVFLADYFSAAFGKFQAIDWSQVSPDNLLGSTSKYDTFFGFTPCIRNLESNS